MINFLAMLFYAIAGVITMGIAFKFFDMITPFDMTKELEEAKNTAIGIVIGSVVLGIAIIIAAAILRCQ